MNRPMNRATTFNIIPGRVAGGHFLAAMALLLGGCMHPPVQDAARVGPFFVPQNYQAAASLEGIRRVVLLPIWTGHSEARETARELDAVLRVALLQQNRFEVVLLSRTQCQTRFQSEALASAAALPPQFFSWLRREFAADAVLFVDLTAFNAYPPLTMGFRAKLARFEETSLVWSFDQVFAAMIPEVANSARHHYLGLDHGGVPADGTGFVLQSPLRFAGYAATAMFGTLPPVRLNSVAPAPHAIGSR